MKEYQDFLNALDQLTSFVKSYYIYDDFGERPKLYEEDIQELTEKYREVFKLSFAYMEAVPEKDAETEKANMEHTDLIQEQLQNDMNALMNYKSGVTLPSLLKYANSRIVNVTGKTFNTVGANSNRRLRMTITGLDGKPVKGFFTERHYVGLNPDNAPYYVNKLSRQRPEFTPIFEFAIPQIFAHNQGGYLYYKNTEELKNRFGQIKDFDEALEMLEKLFLTMLKKEDLILMYLGEKNSASPFETRNVAMSNVAHLFDLDDLIAKSTLLTIRNNGNDQQGSFMEFAKGEDPANPDTKNGNMINMNESSFDHAPILKSLSDMQVLDYICGNTDRHCNNMFYQCDKTGKVIGVMGIDNDMSFGYRGKKMGSNNSCGLKSIFHISKSMYEKLMVLDKRLLLRSLDGLGFEQKLLDMTIERLDALREKISTGDVIIIDDKDYENYKLSDFVLKDAFEKKTFTYKDKTIDNVSFISIYGHVSKVIPDMMRRKKRFMESGNPDIYPGDSGDSGDSDKVLDYIDTTNVKFENLEIGKDAPAVTRLKNKLERAEKYIHNGSLQFEKVRTTMSQLCNATNMFGKHETLLTASNITALYVLYKNLLKDCADYLQHKKDQGKLNARSWTTTGKRIAAVRSVVTFCNGRLDVLKNAIDKTMDREYVEKSEIREMKNEAQKLMLEGMTPVEVGTYIKSLMNMQAKNSGNKQLIAKLGQQMSMCVDYIKKKGVDTAAYGLSKDDLINTRELLREGRAANAELKKGQLDEIKDATSKAAVMK